jgi:hypothetical protein
LAGERAGRPAATPSPGNVILLHYADDIVVGFVYQTDAERFLAAMGERLRQFALTLHPDKTRLLEFGRFAAERRAKRGLDKPESFDFLGFTYICARNRLGRFLVKRRSRRARVRAKLRVIKEELHRRRHASPDVQGQWLRQVVTGWFNYHAVPTNAAALTAFRHHVTVLWLRALRGAASATWPRIAVLVNRWLPRVRILHPWPSARFAVSHPRREPDALIGHVRFCARGLR